MKKICVVTGTRAEYGLLYPMMKRIEEDPDLELQLLVTGAHLTADLGNTINEIEKDGLPIKGKIDLDITDDTPRGISHSMARAITGFSDGYQQMNPDLLIILGDRYEIFMAAAAAAVTRIPIAHIHGGELTEGAIDDAFRHSITKMSHLHFTSTEEYRNRVIQLGEQPDTVYYTGAIGVENIKKLELLDRNELQEAIGFKVDHNTLVVTFHPVTLEKNTSEQQFGQLLKAFDDLPNVRIIFTKANADTDGRIINKMIDEYVTAKPSKAIAFFSLGQKKYFSALKYCGAIAGNSSSGIIEAPSFKIPTVNIGDRQKGRIQAESIINCEPTKDSIIAAIKDALDLDESSREGIKNPYEKADTCEVIVSTIKNKLLNNNVSIKKHFYDIKDR